jgi:single-stranded-DNA-specific exonuclease
VVSPAHAIAFEPDGPIWRLPSSPDPARVAGLVDALALHPVVARLLVCRGIDGPEAAASFLAPDLSGLHDPFRLADMDRAVARIHQALKGGERIAVYGDYDVDGVTSTACLVSFLEACGGDVVAYIPKRLEEGYGLNVAAVEKLAAAGTRLIITCDCGVTAVEEVERAVALGVDVVVIDHHRVPARLPKATAILNPYRDDCTYPFPHLAAVGVTFKLLMALRRHLRDDGFFAGASGRREPNLKRFLDLVALGTIADVVPLVDENRVLATHGLKVLAEGERLGLRALKAVAGVEGGPVSAGQVAFKMAPRINAAGRLDDARAGLDLLLADDPFEAARLAGVLDSANAERQAIEKAIVAEALAQAEVRARGERGLVLSGSGWHPGVVGIVASRVVERFRRPTLVLGIDGDAVRGSGRSAGGFHLYDALAACAEHLERFGGHRAAAGLQLDAARLEAFTAAFLERCRAGLTDQDLVPIVSVDAELSADALDAGLCEALEAAGPFGAGNPTPVFVARGLRLEAARLVGQPGADGKRHLKARLGGCDAIGFGLGDRAGLEGDRVDIAFTLGFNVWRGERRMQLGLKAIVPAGVARVVDQADAAAEAADAFGHVHV